MKSFDNPIKAISGIAGGNEEKVIELTNALIEQHLENKKSFLASRVTLMESYVEGDDDFNVESDCTVRVAVGDTFDLCLTKKDDVVDLLFEFEFRVNLVPSTEENIFNLNEFLQESSKGHRYMMEYLAKTVVDKNNLVISKMNEKNYIVPGCVITGEWPKVSAALGVEYKRKPSLEKINKEISKTLESQGAVSTQVKKSSEDFTLGDHLKVKAVIVVTNIYSTNTKPLSLE